MKLMPSCHEVQAQLTEYAEGTLPPTQRLGVWLHLLLCRVCAAFLRGLLALPGLSRRALAPPPEAPAAADRALDEVLSRLRKP